VVIGFSSSRSFTIANNGSGTICGNVSESSSQYSIISGGGGAYCVEAGGSHSVTVRFTPTSSGTKTCNIGVDPGLCSDAYCTGYGYVYTQVDLASFVATGREDHVEIAWATASEVNNAGFNIYRSYEKDGVRRLLTRGLVAARGDEIKGANYSFTDTDVTVGVTYCYWPEDVDLSGKTTLHGPVLAKLTPPASRPAGLMLAQNRPNPFKRYTEIGYGLPAAGDVTLTIYNLMGQEVITPVSGHQPPGYGIAAWDGKHSNGAEVAGVYISVDCRRAVILRRKRWY
jgi:hypothetical protein